MCTTLFFNLILKKRSIFKNLFLNTVFLFTQHQIITFYMIFYELLCGFIFFSLFIILLFIIIL